LSSLVRIDFNGEVSPFPLFLRRARAHFNWLPLAMALINLVFTCQASTNYKKARANE
jgi:hypothetical protein